MEAEYQSRVWSHYCWCVFRACILTGLGCASPALQVPVLSLTGDTFKRLQKPPAQSSSVLTAPLGQLALETGTRLGESWAFGFLCLILVIKHSVLTPVTGVPKWMWRMWEQRLHWLHLCSSLLLFKMKNALVQVRVTHFFWTKQLRVCLSYSQLIKFYINKSFSLASRKESSLSGSTVVQ